MKTACLIFFLLISNSYSCEQQKLIKNLPYYFKLYKVIYIQKDGKVIVIKETLKDKAPEIPVGDINLIVFEVIDVKDNKNQLLNLSLSFRIVGDKVIDSPLIGKPQLVPYDKVVKKLKDLAGDKDHQR